jgi:hypothetical protein
MMSCGMSMEEFLEPIKCFQESIINSIFDVIILVESH